MRYPYDDFPREWTLTAGYGFGDKTSYGYHDGIDVNGRGGGNSDLGSPIYALHDGQITSIHEHDTGFGLHLHLKIEGPWGVRWSHHAHLNRVFVSQGEWVHEGQKIAEIGNRGTVYAHDHWAVKNAATGVDGVARSLEDLKKWENPVDFVKRWSGNIGDMADITIPTELYERLVSEGTKGKGVFEYFGFDISSDNSDKIIGKFEEITKDLENCRTSASQDKSQLEAEISQLKDEVADLRQTLDNISTNPPSGGDSGAVVDPTGGDSVGSTAGSNNNTDTGQWAGTTDEKKETTLLSIVKSLWRAIFG